MKITPKMLHLPPYISTSWNNIAALYIKENTLIISLREGIEIPIPGLAKEIIDAIFAAHSLFLEEHNRLTPPKEQTAQFRLLQSLNPQLMAGQQPAADGDATLRFSFGNLESINSALHHNPAQANMPDLPKEILTKISSIAKIVAPDEIQNMPKPEPHCNCMHCQIARAIHQIVDLPVQESVKVEAKEEEEDVSEEDLKFQTWDIIQSGDKLFTVVNKLDPQERYSVFLGTPVGCTCGKQGCEHILAVLKS